VARPTASATRKDILANLKSRLVGENYSTMEMNGIPSFILNENKMEFSISDCLATYAKKETKFSKPFINLKALYIIFYGASSSLYEMSTISFRVIDDRLKTPASPCHGTCNSAGVSVFFMSMDGSIHRDNINCLSLEIENTNNIFKEGVVWGSIKIQLAINVSDNAGSYAIMETLGQTLIDTSVTTSRSKRPDQMHLTYGEEARKEIGAMIKRKQISIMKDPMGNAVGKIQAGSVASFTPEELREREETESNETFTPSPLVKRLAHRGPGPSKSAMRGLPVVLDNEEDSKFANEDPIPIDSEQARPVDPVEDAKAAKVAFSIPPASAY